MVRNYIRKPMACGHNDKKHHAKGMCRECYRLHYDHIPKNKHKAYAKRFEQPYRDASRRRKLKNEYGLSIPDYESMLASQNGVCLICNLPEKIKDRIGLAHSLCVDHCHRTGMIRGLLCRQCNILLSKAEDNCDRLRSAILYLKSGLPEIS